jgi:hypothetical protein
LKSLFIAILVAYMLASLFVNLDYIRNNYGWYNKFFSCAFNGKVGINDKIKKSVVRVVGEDSEGSGFFVQPDEILTNFHVIANEPSPKIIFPDGSFIVPKRIIGNKDRDLAIIFTEKEYPDMVLDIYSGDDLTLYQNEAFFATGYPMGTDLLGGSTQLRGNFMDDKTVANYQFIQTNISLAQGMSGGPLTDLCGTVMGVNTMGIGGISLFVPINKDLMQSANFTDKDVEKIQVNPNGSPEDVVTSFYVYLKARKMEDAFNLLSQKYLQNTNFTEWNSRFSNVIDVDVISTSKYENTADTVFIKFMTQNWTNNEVELHYYEGAWKTISENGVNKMLQSDIQEVNNPDPSWFNPPLN